MAYKAIVTGVDTMEKASGVYTLRCLILLGDEGVFEQHGVTATSSSFNPLLPPWRTRIAEAVGAYGTSIGKPVDQVMFADFGVLGL